MKIIAMLGCALALSGCAVLTDHTRSVAHAQSALIGAGGENRPDGTIVAVVGGASADVTVVPFVNTKTGEKYVVKDACGAEDIATVETGVAGSAAGGQGGLNPTINGNVTDATGKAAELNALARLQAANPGLDVTTAWKRCPAVLAPALALPPAH